MSVSLVCQTSNIPIVGCLIELPYGALKRLRPPAGTKPALRAPAMWLVINENQYVLDK